MTGKPRKRAVPAAAVTGTVVDNGPTPLSDIIEQIDVELENASTEESAEVAPDVQPYELRAFSTRDVPWGKLGKLADGVKTAAEAAKLGGLDFDVELLQAGFKSSEKPKPGVSPWKTVGHRRAAVRTDTQEFFAYVSKAYPIVQYRDAFTFMDEINPEYVAAGTLGNGRQGFMVVQLPEHKVMELKFGRKTDVLDIYAILRTSHDLSRAIEVSMMTLRCKCMNALSLNSFTAGAPQRWSVKHVGKDPLAKLAAATGTLRQAEAYISAFSKAATDLGRIKLETDEAEAVLHRALTPRRPKTDDQVNHILRAWRDSDTNEFKDNAWGLVQATSEYFEWGRNEGTRTDQSRFLGGLTGATHKYTNRVAQLVRSRAR